MSKWGKFDFKEFEKLAKAFQKALDERVVENFIREFLLEIAHRAERKIKKRTPSSDGQLRRLWKVGKIERRGNSYVVEIFNNLEYASFVENGFRAHWVPGYWQGKTFVYDRDYKPPKGQPGGMQVGPKGGWVEGKFMMAISMKEIERSLPGYLEKRQNELVNQIMNGRPSTKGGGDSDNGQ